MKVRDYKVWMPEEEEALREGVSRHGLGAWEVIRHDPAYKCLKTRTGVQLKDKWRNLVKFKHVASNDLGLGIQAQTRQRHRRGRKPRSSSQPGTSDPTTLVVESAAEPARDHEPKRESQGRSPSQFRQEPTPEQQILKSADVADQTMGRGGSDGAGCRSAVEMVQSVGGVGPSAVAPIPGVDSADVELCVFQRDNWRRDQTTESSSPCETSRWKESGSGLGQSCSASNDGGGMDIPRQVEELLLQQQRKTDRRRRARGMSVKEDRRFGIYDERRYVPMYNADQAPPSGENSSKQESSDPCKHKLKTSEMTNGLKWKAKSPRTLRDRLEKDSPPKHRKRQGPPTLKDGPNSGSYPLKKNGFKISKGEMGDSSRSNGDGHDLGPFKFENNKDDPHFGDKWDAKALPPKKAFAQQMEASVVAETVAQTAIHSAMNRSEGPIQSPVQGENSRIQRMVGVDDFLRT